MGWKWFPTVAWMCDESFAINVSTKLPDDVDENGSTSMYRGLIIPFG